MNIKLKFGISAFIVILLQSGLKLFGVVITGSLSFLSETVDTLSDIVFVFLTIFSIYISQRPPDFEHMYGHSKMDSIGAMIQGVFLITTYIFLIINAIQVIIGQSYIINNPSFGFQILIISFIINVIFSRILIWQGKKRKSLSLQVQGLNLFQDSLRAIVVLVSFVLVIFFNITFLDPFFSIILSIWIIFSAAFLLKKGIANLADVNPFSPYIIEEIKQKILQLEHVNAVDDMKIRASGDELFIDVRLSVEDHISIIHANEITKAISSMSKSYFPPYNVESLVEMNPLSGEISIGDKLINLLHSMKSEFHEILKFKDLNVFRIESEYFLSISIVVDENLSLKEAHDISNNFEQELKKEEPRISRLITHIESGALTEKLSTKQLTCKRFSQDELNSIQKKIEEILRTQPEVKGYHGFEFWSTTDFCVLELHIFLDDNLNISHVHDIITGLEHSVIEQLDIEDLNQIIFHSEPLKGRTDGILF
ncbi:MAG: cation diffusion facilitator family transporter [Candidatus Odinarchaeota archaeon]